MISIGRESAEKKLTGALNGVRGESSCAGDDGAMLKAVCGVGGVIGTGIVCEDCVDDGACGAGAWYGVDTTGDCCGRG